MSLEIRKMTESQHRPQDCILEACVSERTLEPAKQTSACGQLRREQRATLQSVIHMLLQCLLEEKLPVLVGRERRLSIPGQSNLKPAGGWTDIIRRQDSEHSLPSGLFGNARALPLWPTVVLVPTMCNMLLERNSD